MSKCEVCNQVEPCKVFRLPTTGDNAPVCRECFDLLLDDLKDGVEWDALEEAT